MTNAPTRQAFPVLAPMLAFAAGLVFGIGLIVSALVDPAKVLAFLDLAGAWDPALLHTMAVAVAVGLLSFAIAQRRRTSLIGLPLQLPAATAIDRRLVVGALLFGIGWGLAGICPGPGIVVLGMGSAPATLFVVAMLAGMALFDRVERWAAVPAADTVRAVPAAPDASRPADPLRAMR